MTRAKARAVWHGHHDVLISWLPSIAARRAEIKAHKPRDEWRTRLRLLKLVKGKLPEALDDARWAYDDAWRAFAHARRAFQHALTTHREEVEALHKVECVADCPWDGRTIFPMEPER